MLTYTYIIHQSLINVKQKMSKIAKKPHFSYFFLICSLFVLTNCSIQLEKCKFQPDYEKIGESIESGVRNNENIEVRAGNIECPF